MVGPFLKQHHWSVFSSYIDVVPRKSLCCMQYVHFFSARILHAQMFVKARCRPDAFWSGTGSAFVVQTLDMTAICCYEGAFGLLGLRMVRLLRTGSMTPVFQYTLTFLALMRGSNLYHGIQDALCSCSCKITCKRKSNIHSAEKKQ